MTNNNKTRRPSRLLEFLGSMNLAITLLVMLSIASVIGTLLQQNQVVQDYVIKFGPFWFEVYNSLGLYNVYGAAWFMLVVLFLMVSTAACVVRHTPVFVKDMKEYSENLSLRALQHQPNNTSFSLAAGEMDKDKAQQILKDAGFRTRVKENSDGSLVVAGLKGRLNRLGYFFSHIAIIVICIGALMDGTFYMKMATLFGGLEAETRNIPLNEVNPNSWIAASNPAYRGTININEGQRADVLFLPVEDGYAVQQLPFEVELQEFRLSYYDNGMPKTYESDILLYDPELDEPIEKTIEVNHPLYYKNFAIYQSSYADGGSKIDLAAHALVSPQPSSTELSSAVFRSEALSTPAGKFNVEFENFQMHNIVPRDEEDAKATGRKMVNNGPSLILRVRNEQGKAWEYENYMAPSKQDGRWFYMSGVRESVAEPYRYLFIPADNKRSTDRFFKLLALINQAQSSDKQLRKLFPKPMEIDVATYETHITLYRQLITLFRKSGFDGISLFIQENVPEEQQERVAEFYFNQLAMALQSLYLDILVEEGDNLDVRGNLSKEDEVWFEDALVAIGSLERYGPPFYFQLKGFEQIYSSGLQITKSPGKDVVYFGSAMLIIGVFFMFYVRQRRAWIHLTPAGSKVDITLAGRDNRKLPETDEEFAELVKKFQNQG